MNAMWGFSIVETSNQMIKLEIDKILQKMAKNKNCEEILVKIKQISKTLSFKRNRFFSSIWGKRREIILSKVSLNWGEIYKANNKFPYEIDFFY